MEVGSIVCEPTVDRGKTCTDLFEGFALLVLLVLFLSDIEILYLSLIRVIGHILDPHIWFFSPVL